MNYLSELSIKVLHASLNARIGDSFHTLDTDPDVLSQLLADKRSLNTRIAYEKDVNDFFKSMTGLLATPDSILEFLHLQQPQAVAVVLKYKAKLMTGEGRAAPLKEATVNRRIAAIKSLVAMGRKLGVCHYSLDDIGSEKVIHYRDTSGIDPTTFQLILNQCDRSTKKGKRDYALLRLLWSNALRRNEISLLNISDFDPETKTLRILGKGRGTQSESVDLGISTVQAINEWLATRTSVKDDSPLFVSLDFATGGHRLTGDGLRKMLIVRCNKAGVKKQMSPHRIRHSAITAALDASHGDVRRVQKLSRHRKLDTLMIYDDARHKDQRDITQLLDEMF
ncbi:tyrosine-type recombinase/integrase [Nostoc sp. CHAB 5715]|uniref:tyrosine-type recombinase/integrase n=1 Tax=Nostoc sp. CHAB 5715 TaxID=2780400 RepID=UPI001E38B2B2|nr:tyrosine-type recombinase/integrase [Nostoc sp. CHAB 5715]MCC5621028.1 tyrosine-type recombinase/integrase [Nostoc sp. CHAB 5715]